MGEAHRDRRAGDDARQELADHLPRLPAVRPVVVDDIVVDDLAGADESGAHGDRATVGKAEFEKAVGKAFDGALSYDPKAAGAAANAGQPVPVAAPRSAYSREINQLITNLAGTPAEAKKRRFAIGLPW